MPHESINIACEEYLVFNHLCIRQLRNIIPDIVIQYHINDTTNFAPYFTSFLQLLKELCIRKETVSFLLFLGPTFMELGILERNINNMSIT